MNDYPERIVRLPEVREMTGLAASSIWELEQKGKFPKRRKLTKRAVGWLESEVSAWITGLKEAPTKDEHQP